MRTIRPKNDTALRRRLFVPEAFQHPAKGHLGVWQEMIELYSKPGDTILDPMAGVGASLLGALMGRNVICVELEPHFVEPMRASWEKMRTMPMLGHQLGQVSIIQGDARDLGAALADHIITSPPYEGSEVAQSSDAEANRRFRAGEYQGDALKGMGLSKGYTRKPVDAVLTSPPYDHAVSQLPGSRGGKLWAEGARASQERINLDYAGSGENIGHLRSSAYWEAMAQTYAECWRVLRPGGLIALVLKGFTRDGVYQDLPGQTEALLLAAGWEKHDHWRRQLWALSFWRVLQKRRDPAAFDDRLNYEEVLCFRKPEEAGPGNIQAVITSPPFEDQNPHHGGGDTDWTPIGGIGHEKVIQGGYTRP